MCVRFKCILLSSVLHALEVLPVAPPPPPRQLTEEETQKLEEQEEDTLRELRLFLRDVTNRLSQDKRFKAFTKPVDLEEVTVLFSPNLFWNKRSSLTNGQVVMSAVVRSPIRQAIWFLLSVVLIPLFYSVMVYLVLMSISLYY